MRVLVVTLLTAVVYSIWFWGRPVPSRVHLLEKLDSDQDGAIDTWRFDTNQDGKADLVEIDSDHDGRVDRLEVGNPEIQVLDLSKGQPQGPKPRRLAVCLDGVPYEVMAQLWDQGFFREFSRPARVISVFPSLSDVALTEVFHAEKVPGYENLFFDVQHNKIAGGATSTLSKARIPYLQILDYDEPGIFKGLAYLIPIKTYRADLGRFLQRYSAKDVPDYTAHISSTDSLCHVMTQEEFGKYLLEVDTVLRDIYIKHRGMLDLMVFSDHGNSQVVSRRIDVEHFLAERGFQVASSIRDEKSVVIPGFGLVGAMVVYSKPENTVKLAQILSGCEGVDFCTYLHRGAARILSAQGSARISTDPSGKLLKYEIEEGDPLELSVILQQLLKKGQLDSHGFATSEVWFEALAEHEFPNAINAIFAGVNNHVINRANLLVSLKDGYHYGSRFFNELVTLRSTHGSLRKSSMTGFVMRNGPVHREVLPARDLLNGLDKGMAN